MESLAEHIKLLLRIATDALDDEVYDLIRAAKKDLELYNIDINKTISIEVEKEEGGTTTEEILDPLIQRAIALYCKANFGLNNPDADKLQESYLLFKRHLSLSEEYVQEVV